MPKTEAVGGHHPPVDSVERLNYLLWHPRMLHLKEALMAEQLPRPKDKVEVYWFSEQPYGHVTNEDLEKYESGRLGFPNTYFDPEKAHVLYNQ